MTTGGEEEGEEDGRLELARGKEKASHFRSSPATATQERIVQTFIQLDNPLMVPSASTQGQHTAEEASNDYATAYVHRNSTEKTAHLDTHR